MISVTFSGEAGELIQLFTDNRFLNAVANSLLEKGYIPKTQQETEPEDDVKVEEHKVEEDKPLSSEPVTEVPDVSPSEDRRQEYHVSRDEMRHALQEYCVRMTYRYKDVEGFSVPSLCSSLLLQLTSGSANHTSKVDEQYFEAVYKAAIDDFIPDEYAYLLNRS